LVGAAISVSPEGGLSAPEELPQRHLRRLLARRLAVRVNQACSFPTDSSCVVAGSTALVNRIAGPMLVKANRSF
jgi:hypothetical protein